MKVAGFTFIRNAIKYDYPIVEAIRSILPLCDEVIVLVGQSEDDTRSLIASIGSDKIKIHDSLWDDSLRKGGEVLAVETNKAFKLISADVDWCFYIQGDEVFHQEGQSQVQQAMTQHLLDTRVEGLLFDYRHFYGSYDYVGDSRKWYPHEVRIIRNDPEIYSFRDAQGFQKNGRPLNVKRAHAFMHHYGWVKPPEKQQAKQQDFHKLWHSDQWVDKHVQKADVFDYGVVDSLAKFQGTHPEVMAARISEKNWKFDHDITKKNFSLKHRFHYYFEKLTGKRLGAYKNYALVK